MRQTRADGGSHKKLSLLRLVAPSASPNLRFVAAPGRGALGAVQTQTLPAPEGGASRSVPEGL